MFDGLKIRQHLSEKHFDSANLCRLQLHIVFAKCVICKAIYELTGLDLSSHVVLVHFA